MPVGAIDAALAAEPAQRAERLLALPESQWFDRKSVRIEPKKLAECIVAFANADGGTIVVGLSGGKVEGVDSDPKRLNDLMQAAVDFTDPTVPTQMHLYGCVRDDGESDNLLVIEVPPGRNVYATNRDEAYLRLGDESRKLSFAQRRELFYDKSQSSFESERTELRVGDVDRDLLDTYAAVLGAPDEARLLEARELAADDRLTVAGALLFAEHPERALPSAQVRVSRFQGTQRESGSRQNLIGDDRLEGPILRLLDAARTSIHRWQPTRRALAASGRFEDTGLVPEDAWLEGVVNAIVHRSYSIQGDHIHVDIYDDRIVIESPGRFPGLVDPANPLAIKRFARNPRIARVCTDLRITQEFGEGIRRMFDEMRSAGLSDPLYRQTAGSVQLTLSGEPTERRLIDALPSLQQQILAALRDAPELSTGEIAELTGAARPTVLRHLEALRDSDYVRWVGTSRKDPRASWRLSR
jgi:ATP-dependent DNA helicase RecG